MAKMMIDEERESIGAHGWMGIDQIVNAAINDIKCKTDARGHEFIDDYKIRSALLDSLLYPIAVDDNEIAELAKTYSRFVIDNTERWRANNYQIGEDRIGYNDFRGMLYDSITEGRMRNISGLKGLESQLNLSIKGKIYRYHTERAPKEQAGTYSIENNNNHNNNGSGHFTLSINEGILEGHNHTVAPDTTTTHLGESHTRMPHSPSNSGLTYKKHELGNTGSYTAQGTYTHAHQGMQDTTASVTAGLAPILLLLPFLL